MSIHIRRGCPVLKLQFPSQSNKKFPVKYFYNTSVPAILWYKMKSEHILFEIGGMLDNMPISQLQAKRGFTKGIQLS